MLTITAFIAAVEEGTEIVATAVSSSEKASTRFIEAVVGLLRLVRCRLAAVLQVAAEVALRRAAHCLQETTE